MTPEEEGKGTLRIIISPAKKMNADTDTLPWSALPDFLQKTQRLLDRMRQMPYVKQDLDFRRFLLRGNVKVAAEWLLFSLALNILRLHHKIQNGRLGSGLKIPSSFPAGL